MSRNRMGTYLYWVKKRTSQAKSDSGFTLVEMVVALTVVLLMAGAALIAAPGIMNDSRRASCSTAADSVANAITASYGHHQNYSSASDAGLVADGYLVTIPDAEKLVITTASGGVTVTFGSQCQGDFAPNTWGPDAKTAGFYTYGDASSPTYTLGATGPGGGIVFYIATGSPAWGKYLEAAPTDSVVSGEVWGCNDKDVITNAAIGTGKDNTAAILTQCTGTPAAAAQTAHDYSNNGKSDWFLPSKDELNQLCRITNGQGAGPDVCGAGGAGDTFWSSTQVDGDMSNAVAQNFSTGGQNTEAKTGTWSVWPVRAFS